MWAATCRNAKYLSGIARRGIPAACGALLLAGGCRSLPSADPAHASAESAALERSDGAFAGALAHYSEGLLLDSEKDRAGAQAAFAAARRLDPDSRRPVDALVLKLLEQARPAEALDAFEAFCRVHPDDAVAHRDLAHLAELGGDFARASRHYAVAFRLRPDDVPLGYAWIRTLFAAGADREAVRAMADWRRAHPSADTRNLPVYWAMQFVRREHAPARALPCLDLAIDGATGLVQRTEFLFFYGDAAMAAGSTQAAASAFSKILELDPGHVRGALALGGVVYARDGAQALACQRRRMTTDRSRDAAGWLTLAGLCLAAQDRTNAVPALAHAGDALRARGLIPSVAFYLLQGATLDELERHDDAAIVFQEALQLHPHAHDIMNYLAYMWALEGENLEIAANLAQAAVALRPRSGAYLDTLGWVRFRQQRYEEALDLLLRARERMPGDPTVLDHVGDALAALKRDPEAGAYWSLSYANDPTQPAVAAKLRRLGIDPTRIPKAKAPAEASGEDDTEGDDEE